MSYKGTPSLRFQTPTACSVEVSVAVELDNIPVCVDWLLESVSGREPSPIPCPSLTASLAKPFSTKVSWTRLSRKEVYRVVYPRILLYIWRRYFSSGFHRFRGWSGEFPFAPPQVMGPQVRTQTHVLLHCLRKHKPIKTWIEIKLSRNLIRM